MTQHQQIEHNLSEQGVLSLTEKAASLLAKSTKTLVLGAYVYEGKKPRTLRDRLARLEEAVGLALAIELDVVVQETAVLKTVTPATYIGSGKAIEIAAILAEKDIELVFVDVQLSPIQQRNLEKKWNCKVVDRTGLILEIFGRRARTKEGKLQVELAHLTYQKSRLVRSWTHLERQRGGFGFLGGPGETQIEADRRLIGERIKKIELDLEKVIRTRGLNRSARTKVPYPTIALMGYTNAGKSTLFNRLTEADVFTKDLLFATLDPTAREIILGQGRKAILTDTVGFISDLPTMLVAAFRATLEDVLEADIILHVRDISHPDSEAQAEDVRDILQSLQKDTSSKPQKVIEVWNKADLLSTEEQEHKKLLAQAESNAMPVLISALTGAGIEQLKFILNHKIGEVDQIIMVSLAASDGKTHAWLYDKSEILSHSTDDEGDVKIKLRITAEQLGRLKQMIPASAIEIL